MGGACSTYGGSIGTYRILVGKPEGKRSLARPSRRIEDNINMDHQEVGWRTLTGLIWLRIGKVGGHF